MASFDYDALRRGGRRSALRQIASRPYGVRTAREAASYGRRPSARSVLSPLQLPPVPVGPPTPMQRNPPKSDSLTPAVKRVLGDLGDGPSPWHLVNLATNVGRRVMGETAEVMERPAIKGTLGLVSAPVRGLGMLAEEARAGMTGTPSRVTAAPDGGVLGDLTGLTAQAPMPQDIAYEGLEQIGETLADPAPVVGAGLELLGVPTIPAERMAHAIPTTADLATHSPLYSVINPDAMSDEDFQRAALGAKELTAPAAKLGMALQLDPALKGLGELGRIAQAGRVTKAGVEAGEIVADMPEMAAAITKAIAAGNAANVTKRLIDAGFGIEMAQGIVHSGEEALRLGQQKGWSDPEVLGHVGTVIADALILPGMAQGALERRAAPIVRVDPVTGRRSVVEARAEADRVAEGLEAAQDAARPGRPLETLPASGTAEEASRFARGAQGPDATALERLSYESAARQRQAEALGEQTLDRAARVAARRRGAEATIEDAHAALLEDIDRGFPGRPGPMDLGGAQALEARARGTGAREAREARLRQGGEVPAEAAPAGERLGGTEAAAARGRQAEARRIRTRKELEVEIQGMAEELQGLSRGDQVAAVKARFPEVSPSMARKALRVLPKPEAGTAAEEGAPYDGRKSVFDMTKEEFLGKPKITSNRNASDLRPQLTKTAAEVSPEPFRGGLTIRRGEQSFVVMDGEKPIATYDGHTLVVDKAYRRGGIGEELVYDFRTRHPEVPPAPERTRAAQALQEKVWYRIQGEKLRRAAEGDVAEEGAPYEGETLGERLRREQGMAKAEAPAVRPGRQRNEPGGGEMLSDDLAAALREATAEAERPRERNVDIDRPAERPKPEGEIPWKREAKPEEALVEFDPYPVFKAAEEDVFRPGRARQEVPGGDKLTRARHFLRGEVAKGARETVETPELHLTEDGMLEIGDGFHRSMAAADLGHAKVPFRVPRAQLGEIRAIIEEAARAEQVPRPGRPEGAAEARPAADRKPGVGRVPRAGVEGLPRPAEAAKGTEGELGLPAGLRVEKRGDIWGVVNAEGRPVGGASQKSAADAVARYRANVERRKASEAQSREAAKRREQAPRDLERTILDAYEADLPSRGGLRSMTIPQTQARLEKLGISKQEFNEHLLRLNREGKVGLAVHDVKGSIPKSERPDLPTREDGWPYYYWTPVKGKMGAKGGDLVEGLRAAAEEGLAGETRSSYDETLRSFQKSSGRGGPPFLHGGPGTEVTRTKEYRALDLRLGRLERQIDEAYRRGDPDDAIQRLEGEAERVREKLEELNVAEAELNMGEGYSEGGSVEENLAALWRRRIGEGTEGRWDALADEVPDRTGKTRDDWFLDSVHELLKDVGEGRRPTLEQALDAAKDAYENQQRLRSRGAVGQVREPTKGYAEENYRHSERVRVRFPDGSVHYDEIKGLNRGHALWRAKQNWEGAEVEGLGRGGETEEGLVRQNTARYEDLATRGRQLVADGLRNYEQWRKALGARGARLEDAEGKKLFAEAVEAVRAEATSRHGTKKLPTEARVQPGKEKWWRRLWGPEGPVAKMRKVGGKDRPVGAPEDITSADAYLQRRTQMVEMALEGAVARDWYPVSSKAILDMMQGNREDARRFAQLVAIYSPQTAVRPNWEQALRAWNQYKAGAKRIQAGGTRARDAHAEALLLHGKDFEGRKRNNFYGNLMIHIAPNSPELRDLVTVDVHMMRAIGYGKGKDAPGPTAQYDWAQRFIRDVAYELGWEPHEVQAAIWTSQKFRREVLPKALKKGLEPPPVETYDFSNARDEFFGQVNFEVTPHPTTGRLPGIHRASYDQRQEYLAKALEVLRDDGGRDIIADELGIPTGELLLAPGYYGGQLEPGAHARLQMAPEGGGPRILYERLTKNQWRMSSDLKGLDDADRAHVHAGNYVLDRDSSTVFLPQTKGKNKVSQAAYRKLAVEALSEITGQPYERLVGELDRPRSIDPRTRALVAKYAAALGHLYRQEGVGYGKPQPAAKVDKANGYYIDLGRPATPEETARIAEALREELGLSLEEAGALFPKTTAEGLDLVSFNPDLSGKRLISAAKDAAMTVFGESLRDAGAYTEVGGLISNDWRANPNGEGYRRRLAAPGSPDVSATVERLRSRLDEVDADFARRYGWDRAEGAEPSGVAREGGAGERRAERGVEQPRGPPPYEPPATAKEANARGRQAREELARRRDVSSARGVLPGGGGGTRSLAVGLARILKNNGTVDYRGKPLRSAEDLASLAQLYRDPRTETLRLYYVKDGKIVAHEGLTSRMPGFVQVFEAGRHARQIQSIRDRIKRLGATEVWMTHNHPTADPKASPQDIDLTKLFGSKIPEFREHVVTDHGDHQVISWNGIVRDGRVKVEGKDPFRETTAVRPELESIVGTVVDGPHVVADIGSKLHSDPTMVPIIGTNSRGKVQWIGEMPLGLFTNTKNAADTLRGLARQMGVNDFFAVGSDQSLRGAGEALIESGSLRDFVWNVQPEQRVAGWPKSSHSEGKRAAPGMVQGLKTTTEVDPVTGKPEKGTLRRREVREESAPYGEAAREVGEREENFRKWFGGSKVVGEKGAPKRVFHATKRDFDTFQKGEFGFHFGTERQSGEIAADYKKTEGMMMPVYLSIKNPLRLEESAGGWWTPENVASQLQRKGLIESARDLLREAREHGLRESGELVKGDPYVSREVAMDYRWRKEAEYIHQVLRDRGYDGIVYLNRAEGLGRSTPESERARDRLRNASDADFRREFPQAEDSYIAFEPTQIKSQFNRGTFDAKDPNILREESAPYGSDRPGKVPLYSALRKAFEGPKAPSVGRGEQLEAWLKKQPGVKPEELQWTGLDDFLAERRGKRVTREEVQEYLRQNEVVLVETVKGKVPTREERDADAEKKYARLEELQDKSNGDISTLTAAEQREYDRLEEFIEASLSSGGDGPPVGRLDSEPKYNRPDLTLPGGENYREVLLRLPIDPGRIDVKPYRGDRFVATPEADPTFARVGDTAEEAIASVRAAMKDRRSGTFQGGHWDEPNVLAHLRLNDRVDADGKRVLFIEELQSDWHQKGREVRVAEMKRIAKAEGLDWRDKTVKADLAKRVPVEFGYSSPEKRARKLEALSREELIEILQSSDPNGVWSDAAARAEGFDPVTKQEALDKLAEWQADDPTFDVSRFLRDRSNADGVTDAPFKTTWHETALRRVLKMAADEGYDRVAWTTGEQQVERYDLSKRLERIELDDNSTGGVGLPSMEGAFTGGVLRAYDRNTGKEVIHTRVESEAELADHIGKEAAERLLAAEARGASNAGLGVRRRVLSGLDLKVGGEGMKGFYDEILPKYASTFGKKFDAKAGETTLSPRDQERWFKGLTTQERRDLAEDARSLAKGDISLDEFNRDWRAAGVTEEVLDRGSDWWDMGESGRPRGPLTGNPIYQHAKQSGTATRKKVHSIDITPKMRETARSEGFQLFEEKAAYGKKPKGPMGRPMRPDEAPRVEAKVATLPAEKRKQLDRYTRQKWEDLDPAIREILAKDDPLGYLEGLRKVRGKAPLSAQESQALEAIASGKLEMKQEADKRVREARARGDKVGEAAARQESLTADLEYTAAQFLSIQDGTSAGRALAARARVMKAYPLHTPETVAPRIQAAAETMLGTGKSFAESLLKAVKAWKKDPGRGAASAKSIADAMRRTQQKLRQAGLVKEDAHPYAPFEAELRKALESDPALDAQAVEKIIGDFRVDPEKQIKLFEQISKDLGGVQTDLAKSERTASDLMFKRILKEIPGIDNAKATDILMAWKKDPAAVGDLIRGHLNSQRPFSTKAWSWLLEWRKTGMLGPLGPSSTDLRNIFGNVTEAASAPLEGLIATGLDKVLPGASERSLGEVGAEVRGMWRALVPASKQLARDLVDVYTLKDKPLDPRETKLEHQVGAIPGTLGKVMRTAFGKLTAEDQFFKAFAQGGEVEKQAYRRARKELGAGATRRVLLERADQIIEDIKAHRDKYEDVWKRVAEVEQFRTYQEDPGRIGNLLLNAKRTLPVLDLPLPFVKTPYNVFRRGLHRSPAGWVDAIQAHRQYTAGKISREAYTERVARPILGTAVAGLLYMLARQGAMTGSGPLDPEERYTKQATGWTKNSFVFLIDGAKHYVPFDWVEPYGIMAAAVADVAEAQDARTSQELWDKALGSTVEAMKDKSFMQGVEEFIDAISKPQRFLRRYATRLAVSFVPGILGRAAWATDPVLRSTEPESAGVKGFLEGVDREVRKKIPGLSTTLPPRYTPTGRLVETQSGPVSRYIGPTQMTREIPGREVEELLDEVGWSPSLPSRELSYGPTGQKVRVRLTDEEYARVVEKSNLAATRYIERVLLKNSAFRKLPDTEFQGGKKSKEYQLGRVYSRFRAEAYDEIRKERDFRRRAKEAMVELAQSVRRP